jgi:hypothetical protein
VTDTATDPPVRKSRAGGARPGAGRPKVLHDRVKQLFQIERRHLDAIMRYQTEHDLRGISEALREILDRLMEPSAMLAPPPPREKRQRRARAAS